MLVVSPSPCLRRTVRVPVLTSGSDHHSSVATTTAGGSGVTIARTARILGLEATLVGFVAETDGARLLALLDAEKLALRGVPLEGSVRVATSILEDSGRTTSFDEPGPAASEADLDRLVAAVLSLSGSYEAPIVCSDALPPGLPVDTYSAIATLAHTSDLLVVVDAPPPALGAALKGEPDLVVTSVQEAEETTATEPSGSLTERACSAGTVLVERGATRALVSAGPLGACLVDARSSTWIDAPTVVPVDADGARGSLVAGLCFALSEGLEWENAARFGVAVASAATESAGAGSVDVDRVGELYVPGPEDLG